MSAAGLVLRAANASLGFALLGVVWHLLWSISGRPRAAALLALPLACSSYVMFSTVYVTTDTGALLFFALALHGLALGRGPLRAGVASTLMVLWRQMYLPVVGAFAVPLLRRGRTRRDALVAAAAILPPLLLVAAYRHAWGGLVPPAFRDSNGFTFEPAVPLHALALTGLFSVAYLPLWRPLGRQLGPREWKGLALAASALGTTAWLLASSTYEAGTGRRGSLLWLLARHTPELGEHSLVFLPCGLLGAGALGLMALHAWRARSLPAELLVLLAYLVGVSAQPNAFQRYLEPPLMIAFAVFSARLPASGALGWSGPVALAAVFGAMSLARLYGLVGQLFG